MNPGYDMLEFCNICDSIQFMSMYLQILFSLHTAYTDFGFTHYDLHGGNIMVQKTNNNQIVYIPYMYKGTKYYVMTRSIAKIIDYGKSHVDLNDGQHIMGFGNFTQESLEINPLKSNPMHDVFKITGYLLLKLSNINKSTYIELHGLMRSFRPFDQTKTHKEMKKLLWAGQRTHFEYSVGDNSPVGLVNSQREFFEGYIDRILESSITFPGEILFKGRPITIVPNSKILECEGDCYDRARIERELHH